MRLPLAPLLQLAAFVGSNAAQARPTHADLAAARTRLSSLNDHQELLAEQYDQAQVALGKAERNLAAARTRVAQADAKAATARRELDRRASLAYQGVGSQLDTIFGATSLSQLSDRL